MLSTVILTAIAVSIDGMIAGFVYGAVKIKVPLKSLCFLSCVPIVMCLITMNFANLFVSMVSEDFVRLLGFFAMLCLSFMSVRQYFLSKKQNIQKKDITNILIKPELADLDGTKDINLKEALVLGFAVGVDASAASATLALLQVDIIFCSVLMGFIHFVFIGTGNGLGKKLKIKADFLRLVSAAIFLVLAFIRIM
ncbi:MAG: manganese efflux pump [Clostridia bacterium]